MERTGQEEKRGSWMGIERKRQWKLAQVFIRFEG
jgi:hypothetical protein